MHRLPIISKISKRKDIDYNLQNASFKARICKQRYKSRIRKQPYNSRKVYFFATFREL